MTTHEQKFALAPFHARVSSYGRVSLFEKPLSFKLSLIVMVVVASCFISWPKSTWAITRTQVMIRARSFVYHPWRCTSANIAASCDPGYSSVYVPGDYMGLPYDWGGYVSLFEFDQDIVNGLGAGSTSADGVLSCTTGLDCSGYVSQAWNTPFKYGTWTLEEISHEISQSEVLPGDCFNIAGYHVILFSHALANGDPVFFEAIGYNTQINVTGGWSHVASYTPRRYDQIEGSSADNPLGSPDNPIKIETLPYSDSRNTTQSETNILDGCGLAPNTDESGPEYIYEVNFDEPGTLTVSVSDDIGVDIDVHLFTSMNSNDCIARHDSHLSVPVDCGTYFIVADTYVGSNGTEYSGPYDLTVDFSPSGGGCGSPPVEYDFEGKPGDPCAYPGNEDLPFCNPNLDSTVCLYNNDLSFCSKPCASAADCNEIPGACCEDIGSNEYYCLVSQLCTAPTVDGGLPDAEMHSDSGVYHDGSSANGDSGEGENDGETSQPDGSLHSQDGGEGQHPTDSNSSGCSCFIIANTKTHSTNRENSKINIIPALLFFLLISTVRIRRRGASTP